MTLEDFMMQKKKGANLNTQSVLAMRSSGYYSQKTAGAKIAIDATQKLLERALNSLPNSEILRFADFGCADGGTSQELWYNIVKLIRESGDNRPIEMIYTDLASNDFSTLFKSMQGMGENSDLAYQDKFDDIFVHGCGTGFHKQLMPSETLCLGFSATAMHYVSEKPCQIKDHVHMVGADSGERMRFEEQALNDWEAILLARGKELMPGGKFICINFGIDEKGQYLGNTGGHSMFEKFRDHWYGHLKSGIINEEEYISATFPQHYRTVEEFCRPFSESNSLVEKAGLRLNSCSTRLTKCPYRENYENKKNNMTPSEYAKSLIPTTRSWSETVFRTALAGRDPGEIDQIVDSFYENYENEVASNPDGHAMDYIHIVMEIEKV